ncbi:MAG: hypothetical protein ACHQ6U_05980 [Thermodesulfobacteriota bacterium]
MSIQYNIPFYKYPLQPLDVVTKLGVSEMSLHLLRYLRQKLSAVGT